MRQQQWSDSPKRHVAAFTLTLLGASVPLPLTGHADLRGVPGIDSQGPVPSVLERTMRQAGEPLWVRAEAAVGPDGNVDWELLGEDARKAFESVARQTPISDRVFDHYHSGIVEKRNPDGTITTWHHYGPTGLEMPVEGSWRSLKELAEDAEVIYLGKVVGFAEGFFAGGPGSLLTVQLQEVLRASDERQVGSEIYVYYPSAQFSIGGVNFWKSDPAFPERPAVGDRIFIADNRPSPDLRGSTVIPRAEAIFIESVTDNGMALKGGMKSVTDTSSGLDEVLKRMRLLMRQEVPR